VCAALHANMPALAESLIVNTNGTLRNVFVYVKEVAGAYAPPKAPILLDQRACRYEPHVFGIQVGQPLWIRNSDRTTHNIHALPSSNPEFNHGQPPGNPDLKRTFISPDFVTLACDVHPWMRAYAGVLLHPFFAVTGEDGAFELPI